MSYNAFAGGSPQQPQVICPVCGDEYVHFADEPSYLTSDDYEGVLGYRGDEMLLPMYCETGHVFNIYLAFHKGQMFWSARRRPGWNVADDDDECCECGEPYRAWELIVQNPTKLQADKHWGHAGCMVGAHEHAAMQIKARQQLREHRQGH